VIRHALGARLQLLVPVRPVRLIGVIGVIGHGW
jgi:hypothetical protein